MQNTKPWSIVVMWRNNSLNYISSGKHKTLSENIFQILVTSWILFGKESSHITRVSKRNLPIKTTECHQQSLRLLQHAPTAVGCCALLPTLPVAQCPVEEQAYGIQCSKIAGGFLQTSACEVSRLKSNRATQRTEGSSLLLPRFHINLKQPPAFLPINRWWFRIHFQIGRDAVGICAKGCNHWSIRMNLANTPQTNQPREVVKGALNHTCLALQHANGTPCRKRHQTVQSAFFQSLQATKQLANKEYLIHLLLPESHLNQPLPSPSKSRSPLSPLSPLHPCLYPFHGFFLLPSVLWRAKGIRSKRLPVATPCTLGLALTGWRGFPHPALQIPCSCWLRPATVFQALASCWSLRPDASTANE